MTETQTIRRGSSGLLVSTWQAIVNRMFADDPPPMLWSNARGESRGWPGGTFVALVTDGHFGPATELATEAWQFQRGLLADGVVGPKTWSSALGGRIDGRPPLLYGVDVSALQGTLADSEWAAMRANGIRFGFARTCVGNESWIDAEAGANLRRAADHGIALGCYFFGFPLPHIKPRDQVDQWIRRCELAGIDLGDRMCALDIEWPPREEWKVIDGKRTLTYPWRKWVVTAESIAEWNLRALERARVLTGREWIRYSYRYFLDCIGSAGYGELAAGPLWLADYFAAGRWPSADEVGRSKAPAPWSQITIMQHDGDGGLRLPNGRDADFNVMQGGEARLRALIPSGLVTLGPVPLADEASRPDIMPDAMIGAYRRTRITGAASVLP